MFHLPILWSLFRHGLQVSVKAGLTVARVLTTPASLATGD